jgi:hypothetical protein
MQIFSVKLRTYRLSSYVSYSDTPDSRSEEQGSSVEPQTFRAWSYFTLPYRFADSWVHVTAIYWKLWQFVKHATNRFTPAKYSTIFFDRFVDLVSWFTVGSIGGLLWIRIPWKTGDLLISWATVSFSRRNLLRAISYLPKMKYLI